MSVTDASMFSEQSSAEAAILAAMICSSECIPEVLAKVNGKDFIFGDHPQIFEAISRVNEQELKPEIPVLMEHGVLASRVMELENHFVSTVNLNYYLTKVGKASVLRGVQGKIDAGEDYGLIVSAMRDGLQRLDAERKHVSVGDLINEIDTDIKTGGHPGIPTSIPGLDNCTGGLQPSHFIVIGARPAVGKTALAINISVSAMRAGRKVSFFSLEMPAKSIVQRALSLDAGVPVGRLMSDLTSDEEKADIQSAKDLISDGRLMIHDVDTNIEALCEDARRDVRGGAELLVLDYINLVTVAQYQQRWEKVSEITRKLKNLAMELEVPLVGLAQLSRESQNGDGPSLAHLRESSTIEQDADLVGLLSRGIGEEEATLDVQKNRHGAPRKIQLTFNAQTMKFSERWG